MDGTTCAVKIAGRLYGPLYLTQKEMAGLPSCAEFTSVPTSFEPLACPLTTKQLFDILRHDAQWVRWDATRCVEDNLTHLRSRLRLLRDVWVNTKSTQQPFEGIYSIFEKVFLVIKQAEALLNQQKHKMWLRIAKNTIPKVVHSVLYVAAFASPKNEACERRKSLKLVESTPLPSHYAFYARPFIRELQQEKCADKNRLLALWLKMSLARDVYYLFSRNELKKLSVRNFRRTWQLLHEDEKPIRSIILPRAITLSDLQSTNEVHGDWSWAMARSQGVRTEYLDRWQVGSAIQQQDTSHRFPYFLMLDGHRSPAFVDYFIQKFSGLLEQSLLNIKKYHPALLYHIVQKALLNLQIQFEDDPRLNNSGAALLLCIADTELMHFFSLGDVHALAIKGESSYPILSLDIMQKSTDKFKHEQCRRRCRKVQEKGGVISQLTADSVFRVNKQEEVRRGGLDIASAIGDADVPGLLRKPNYMYIKRQQLVAARIVVYTDGLSQGLTAQQVAVIVEQQAHWPAKAICHNLIMRAASNQQNGICADNTTVAIVSFAS